MPQGAEDAQSVAIEEALEALVVDIESAVVTYLVRITDESRETLGAALGALDEDTAASDAFRSRFNARAMMLGGGGLGTSSLNVIGQTTRFPIVNQVPLPVFQAQVALVRAAKAEVRDPSPETLDALETANADLAEMRRRFVS